MRMGPGVNVRYFERPAMVDCKTCHGRGMIHSIGREFQTKDCGTCALTGLDPIPWQELYMLGRGSMRGGTWEP